MLAGGIARNVVQAFKGMAEVSRDLLVADVVSENDLMAQGHDLYRRQAGRSQRSVGAEGRGISARGVGMNNGRMCPPAMLTIHIAPRPQPRSKRLRYFVVMVVVAVLAYMCWMP